MPHQACVESEEPGPTRQPTSRASQGQEVPWWLRPWSLAGLGPLSGLWLWRRPGGPGISGHKESWHCILLNKLKNVPSPGLGCMGSCGFAWRHPKTTSQVCVALLLGSFPFSPRFSFLVFFGFLCLVVEGLPSGRQVPRPWGRVLCLSPFGWSHRLWFSHLVGGRIHLWSPLLSGFVWNLIKRPYEEKSPPPVGLWKEGFGKIWPVLFGSYWPGVKEITPCLPVFLFYLVD